MDSIFGQHEVTSSKDGRKGIRTSMWSILDLSVLELAGNFSLKCNSGNSSFHHLLEHDLLLLVVSA